MWSLLGAFGAAAVMCVLPGIAGAAAPRTVTFKPIVHITECPGNGQECQHQDVNLAAQSIRVADCGLQGQCATWTGSSQVQQTGVIGYYYFLLTYGDFDDTGKSYQMGATVGWDANLGASGSDAGSILEFADGGPIPYRYYANSDAKVVDGSKLYISIELVDIKIQ